MSSTKGMYGMTGEVQENPRELFQDRHIGPSRYEEERMLREIGEQDLDTFIAKVIPSNIFVKDGMELPSPLSETEVIEALRQHASANKSVRSMMGMGYYDTITPPVILRNVLENPGWYTAYTPYQPEISQGRLEAIFAFQTVVSDMTGLPIANASMLDEATAAAEAMTLARRISEAPEDASFLVDTNLHPHIRAVMATRAKPLKISIIELDFRNNGFTLCYSPIFGAIIAQFGTYGDVNNDGGFATWCHENFALAIVATDLLGLSINPSPGHLGADVAVGSAQRFGVPMGFGGPHAGFLSVREGLERSLPGRLVGQSVDSHGNPAFRLALQTREQHIRRDKATSNICTAQVLLAVMSGLYAMWHGPQGIQSIASRINSFALTARRELLNAGFEVSHSHIFDTIEVRGVNSSHVIAQALERGYNFRPVDPMTVTFSFDERTTSDDLQHVLRCFDVETSHVSRTPAGGENLRKEPFLTHRLFHSYHSETAMMRYLRALSDRDLALDRTMIPLGSCTMKLNAVTEMAAVTWPEFASLHPFAPKDQSAGSRALIAELSSWLLSITGYDAVSLQPNAGSQGEFAGLLAIRNYLDSRGEFNRRICLIPSSAHGTNAASAVMAGMQVVVVACDDHGNVSVADLQSKIDQHADELAALMVTYPSTHGVFEEAISEICSMVHDAGGQVYVDGANLNALVGLAKPGKFGADVSHLNLHKTFCIPHGGGGPGVGPVIARSHLAPFLPNHPLDDECGPSTGPGPVSSAPFGSAGILPISWAYIRLMGNEGLQKATKIAILSANYIAKKLDPYFPVLYKGAHGFVAHECILDLREITKKTGVSVDDIAKRLMDHGFHAPTMSFPVAGTLMVEPTESENLAELDRFIAAMISIKAEISDIEKGHISIDESPLRHAPHTSADLLRAEWDRKYPRTQAAFPTGNDVEIGRAGKYWPTVGRIDGVYGDRNLVCACLPMEAYA
jgi:glycine dehydrogenase